MSNIDVSQEQEKRVDSGLAAKPENPFAVNLNETAFALKKAQIAEARHVRAVLSRPSGDMGRAKMEAAITKLDALVKGDRVKEEREAILEVFDYPEAESGVRIFASPTGETIVEEVMFFKRSLADGTEKYLSHRNGEPVTVNADLWAARLPVKPSWALSSYRHSTMPICDGRGSFSG